MDFNQHVNHVKYIDWILEVHHFFPFFLNTIYWVLKGLYICTYIYWIININCDWQSVPHWILESKKMTSITLEFKKECGINSVLQSLCALSCRKGCTESEGIELEHTIRLQNQSHVILRGRTMWMPNHQKQSTTL